MKVTLELPEEVCKALKFRAVREGRKLEDVAAAAIRRGLSAPSCARLTDGHRVSLPVIKGRRPAPGKEPTPEQIADVLTAWEDNAPHNTSGR